MNHRYFLKFVWQFSILYDLSLAFAFIYLCLCLYLSLCLLSCLHISDTHPILLPTLWIYFALCTSNQKLFLTLPFFFFFVPIIAQLPVNKEQIVKYYTNIFYNLYKLSLSLYIYIIRERERERVINIVTESHKAKKKKKPPHAQIQFTITNSVHHSSIKIQTPQVHKHRLLDSKIHKYYIRFWRKW